MSKKAAKKLDELFHDTLKDIYFAEKKILATLPKMEKAAQASELKNAFAKHRIETEDHVARLEEVFAAIDLTPACWRQHKPLSTMKSPAMGRSKRGRVSLD
jgi:ferritin-like metal-binding protein YciE